MNLDPPLLTLFSLKLILIFLFCRLNFVDKFREVKGF